MAGANIGEEWESPIDEYKDDMPDTQDSGASAYTGGDLSEYLDFDLKKVKWMSHGLLQGKSTWQTTHTLPLSMARLSSSKGMWTMWRLKLHHLSTAQTAPRRDTTPGSAGRNSQWRAV